MLTCTCMPRRHLALLEPLLPLLQRSMRADSDAVVSLSLRTVGALMAYPLPSLPQHATNLLDRTLQILKRSANTRGSELVGIGIKVVTALLRKPPAKRGGHASHKRPRDSGVSAEGSGGAGAENQAHDAASDSDDDDDDDGFNAGESTEPSAEHLATGQARGPQNRVGGGATLSEPQLRWIITFVTVHLEDVALQGSLFGLLRVIFGRRFVLAELYDLILVLGDMVLQADSSAVRQACAQLFLTFLLRYPLGPKRLQQHLNFLVTNLAYPVAVGRVSLVKLIFALVDKLPLPVLHRQSDLLLLPLITRLVNDDDQDCRSTVGEAITRLIARTCDVMGGAECASAREKLLKLLHAWYSDSSTPALSRAAAQLTGLVIDALGAGAGAIASQVLPLVIRACENEVTGTQTPASAAGAPSGDVADVGNAEDDGSRRERWQSVYYSLHALLRLTADRADLLMSDACDPLWAPLHTLLLHEHAWVRNVSSRVLGALLANVSLEALVNKSADVAASGDGSGSASEGLTPRSASGAAAGRAGKKSAGQDRKQGDEASQGQSSKRRRSEATGDAVSRAPPPYLCQRGVLLELTDALLQQLHSPLLAEKAAAQTLKNLLWLCMAFIHHPQLAPRSSRALLPGGDASDHLTDAAELPAIAPSKTAGAEPQWSCWPLEAVAARLVPLTHTPGHVRGCIAVRWYAAVATQLGDEQLRAMLPLLLVPIARASEDESGKVHLRVKELAAEVLQLIQKRAAPPDFVAAYQRFKDAQRALRRERKQREALASVAYPERTAQIRIAKNLGKRQGKKRKLERTKRERDSGGSVGLGSKKSRRPRPAD